MEATLGLLGGGSSGVSSNESAVSKVETLDVGMCSEATSYPEEAELELGLSLGGGGARPKPSAWGERGRILTAKDFPSVLSHASSAAFAVSGTKRPSDSAPHEASSPPRSSQVVGWPPIRAYRMNSLVNQAKTTRDEEDKAVDEKGNAKDVFKNVYNDNKSKTDLKAKDPVGFVKVSMVGIGIGRKVSLNAHACYETLAQALECMFLIESGGEKEPSKKSSKLLGGSSEFVLTYEDKEGDWMLVGDVPWRMFVSTVKRLRIMRTSEAKGLAPRVQETNERQRRKPV